MNSEIHLANAMDHGIEAPEVRIQAGKAPEGTISLGLHTEADQILITVEDDGTGLNLERIRAKAVEQGLMQADQSVTPHQLASFILEPSFSTAERTTEFSGRGVGLHAVRSFVQQQGGQLDIQFAEAVTADKRLIRFRLIIRLPLVSQEVKAWQKSS